MISGKFIIVDVPKVPAGQHIKATVEWYGINTDFSIWNIFDPGWKSFLVAEAPTIFRKVLDDTRERQRDFSRKRTFDLGVMPDKKIAITFSLWGHHEAYRDWDWLSYEVYMRLGSGTELTAMALETRIISPGTTPTPEPPARQPQTLEVDITPPAGGHVATSPAPITGYNYWRDGDRGQFQYGTVVQVTAHAHAGYRFDHWSDEIAGGTNYSNPAKVAGVMDEHKAVKAHFRETEEPVPGPAPPPEPTPTPGPEPTPEPTPAPEISKEWAIPILAIIVAAILLIPSGKKEK